MVEVNYNLVYAVGALIVALVFANWFTAEAVKEKRETVKYGVSMALMVAAAAAFLFFGAKFLKNMKNGPMPTNVNAPSNALGSNNAAAPAGAPATNAAVVVKVA